MHTVDNKFEIGEECYTYYRKPVYCECPFCKGSGKLLYNGYEIWCKQCDGSGELRSPQQSVLATCKVRIRRLIASIWKDQTTIKYKVDCVDNITINIRNRNETTLFKTIEEAEKYCVEANTKQITPEF